MKNNGNGFNWDGKLVQFLELMIDMALVLLGYTVALIVTSDLSWTGLFDNGEILPDYLTTSAIFVIFSFFFFRIYRTSVTKRRYSSAMFRVVLSMFIVHIIAFLASMAIPDFAFEYYAFILSFVFALLFLGAFNGFFAMFLRKVNKKTALIIGPEDEVNNLAKKILFDDNEYIGLKYLVYDEHFTQGIQSLYDYIQEVDYIYLTEHLDENIKNLITSYCYKIQKPFFLVPKLYELSIHKAEVTQMSDTLVYQVRSLGLNLEDRFVKRVFDLFVSIIGLTLFMPFFLLIAMVIKLHDRGPVFFKQKRVTKNNKIFNIIKFRTMIVDAEKDTGAVQASEDDERITPIGRFLRYTRLDEVPQLFNVLEGDLSLVGPRSLRIEEVEEFISQDYEFRYRMNVKAGITGFAQTMGKYYTNPNDKLRFDIFYIANYSFLNDIVILLHTFRVILDPGSARGIQQERSVQKCLKDAGFDSTTLESGVLRVMSHR